MASSPQSRASLDGWGRVLAVALLLAISRSPLRAAADEAVERLDFSKVLTERVSRLEQAKRAALGRSPREADPAPVSEGDRITEGSRAIERVLTDQLSTGSGGTTTTVRDVDRELATIVAAEIESLGDQKADLEPRATLERQLPNLPVVRVVKRDPRYRLINQSRVGYEGSDFRSASATPATSDIGFAEYLITYVGHPAPRSDLRIDNAIYEGTLRTSDTGTFNLDHRFNHRLLGTIGGTLILDRYISSQSVNDSLLAEGYQTIVLHLPDHIDLTHRYTYGRKIFEQETPVTLSSLTKVDEWRVEKRVALSTLRMEFASTEYDFPSDRPNDLLRTDILFGYSSPVSKKIDLDYTFIREKETTNLDAQESGSYIQGTNRADLLFRFSPAMSLDLYLELENRDYRRPDPTFISYNRNLWNPMLTVLQTAHLSYTVGFFEEIWLYRDWDQTDAYVASDNDNRTQQYRALIRYAKKRFSGSLEIAFGPTHYLNSQTVVQSDYDSHDTAVSLLYRFTSDTEIAASFTRASQLYRTPTNNNTTDTLSADLTHRF